MVELAIHLETTNSNHMEAQVIAWFRTAIQQESARLERERKHLLIHELLILDAPSTPNGENMLSELVASENTEFMAEDELFLEGVLMVLTRKQRIVILETVIQEIPEKIVASEFRTTQQAVHRLKTRALKKLRAYLSDCYKPTEEIHCSSCFETIKLGE